MNYSIEVLRQKSDYFERMKMRLENQYNKGIVDDYAYEIGMKNVQRKLDDLNISIQVLELLPEPSSKAK
jgi:hypothetical protein